MTQKMRRQLRNRRALTRRLVLAELEQMAQRHGITLAAIARLADPSVGTLPPRRSHPETFAGWDGFDEACWTDGRGMGLGLAVNGDSELRVTVATVRPRPCDHCGERGREGLTFRAGVDVVRGLRAEIDGLLEGEL